VAVWSQLEASHADCQCRQQVADVKFFFQLILWIFAVALTITTLFALLLIVATAV